MKITFGIIVLNGEMFLRQVLESIYPFAHAICIAEGPVGWWVQQGVRGSTDGTIQLIQGFPDPEKKIRFIAGIYNEKTEQCRDWFKLVPEDTDYVWCVDSDEVFKPEDISKVINVLESRKPGSICFQSYSFFGGFNHYLGNFEWLHNFKRVLKYEKGAKYVDHRPPTLSSEYGDKILGQEMADRYDVRMYHYSYVSPKQVYEKVRYYKGAVSKDKCINNYFHEIWLAWVTGPTELRATIEDKFNGVHEFVPSYRGECRTVPFIGDHPPIIQRDMQELVDKFNQQLKSFELEMFVNNKEEEDFLFKSLSNDMLVLEYGSGRSTLAIAKRVRKLISVEHDPKFYEFTKRLLESNGVENVILLLHPPTSNDYDDGSIEQFKNYVQDPLRFAPFDVCFIDGRARVDCARAVKDQAKVIFIHDYKNPNEQYRRFEYEVVESFLNLESQVYAMAKFTTK